jgi:hypothetical protein
VSEPGVNEPGTPDPGAVAWATAGYELTINGAAQPVADAWIGENLLFVLRERLGFTAVKDGCGEGECGRRAHGKAGPFGGGKDDCAHQPDRKAGDGGGPDRGGKGAGAKFDDGQGQPGEEHHAQRHVIDDLARRQACVPEQAIEPFEQLVASLRPHAPALAIAWKKVPLTWPRRKPEAPIGVPRPSARSASGSSLPVADICA